MLDYLMRPLRPFIASEHRLNPAKWTYERLVKQILGFEAQLSPEQELGGRFVTAPKDGPIHIEDLVYWEPDLLIFRGRDADGRPFELIQHHTQLSVLLCALPTTREEPRRIGFLLEQRVED